MAASSTEVGCATLCRRFRPPFSLPEVDDALAGATHPAGWRRLSAVLEHPLERRRDRNRVRAAVSKLLLVGKGWACPSLFVRQGGGL